MELTHVIIFHDKSKLLTTKQDFDTYVDGKKKGNKGQIINGSAYSFSSYAKYMAIQDFYEQYPAERPNPIVNNVFPTIDDLLNEVPDRIKLLKGIIKGLKNYIKSTESNPLVDKWGNRYWYKGTQAPIEMLKKREMQLKIAQEEKEE